MNDKYFKDHKTLINEKLTLQLERRNTVFYQYLMFI